MSHGDCTVELPVVVLQTSFMFWVGEMKGSRQFAACEQDMLGV